MSMRSQLDSLPDELLELILHHATSSLRADSKGDSDILHRAASWSSLASVNRRWRQLMQRQPVDLTLRYSWNGDQYPDVSTQVHRLEQLGRSSIPVLRLAVLQPLGNKPAHKGWYLPPPALCCAVSQLLATPKFQEHSGGMLDCLSIEEEGNQSFEFAAPPGAYPRLTSLHGVGGQLLRGLPASLQSLEYNACVPGLGFAYLGKHLDGACEAISRLEGLTHLTFRGCYEQCLPPSFLPQLPSTLQVALQLKLMWMFSNATESVHVLRRREALVLRVMEIAMATIWRDAVFVGCLLDTQGGRTSALAKWRAAMPEHLQIVHWCDWDQGYNTVVAVFQLESGHGPEDAAEQRHLGSIDVELPG